jgi:hypothetical protein
MLLNFHKWSNNSTITRVSNSIFKIKDTSLYEIIFQINIRQGQLIIVMNDQLAHTLLIRL